MNSLSLVPNPVSSDAAGHDSVAIAAHLIGLLEKQPACLMRVGLDGMLLATNDAALSLLGATQLSQVLGTILTERVVPAHQALWRDFTDRVWQDASGSIELDMVDLSGASRTLLVQGVALADHPDGIRSLLAAVRDVSATRHLEVTLQELEKTLPGQETANQLADELHAQLEGMRAQLDATLAERTDAARAMDALRGQLAQSIAERQRLETAANQDKADRQCLELMIERHEADRQRLESALEQRDADGRQVQSALDESHADREQFESSLKQRETNRQRLLAEHATARVRVEIDLAEAASQNERLTQLLADQGIDLQRTDENTRRLEALAAAGQLALDAALAARAEAVQAIDALRAQLEQSSADRLRLESAADEDKADRQRLESVIEQRDVDCQRLETAIEQRDAHRRQLQSTLDESLAERQEFESAVKQRAANRQRLLAEHASARVRAESALAEAASRNEQLTELLADQGLDLRRTEENARRLEALAIAGQLALDAALLERTEASQAIDVLRAQLDQSSADRLELETAADQDKAGRQRLELMIERGDADRQRLESTIEQRDVDRRRLESTIEEHDADRRRLESTIEEHDADRRQLQSVIERHDADRRRLQSTLDESLAERQEFESAVKQRAANRQRLLSEHAAARVRVEGALAEATSRNEQLTKRLADQGLDLLRTEENARRLESLAGAGRMALDVARELQTIVGELDARTKDLLAECPLEADEREDMEGFRNAAIRAASLARQIVQAERTA